MVGPRSEWRKSRQLRVHGGRKMDDDMPEVEMEDDFGPWDAQAEAAELARTAGKQLLGRSTENIQERCIESDATGLDASSRREQAHGASEFERSVEAGTPGSKTDTRVEGDPGAGTSAKPRRRSRWSAEVSAHPATGTATNASSPSMAVPSLRAS